MNRWTKLNNNGRINPNSICPFKDICSVLLCKHKGINHPCEFGCATARFFDIKFRSKED